MEVMARYGGGADVAWRMGRIMLKYRPIAPRPVNGGGSATVASTGVNPNGGRGKRRGTGAKEGRRGRKRGKKEAAGVFQETGVKRNDDEDKNNGSIYNLPSPAVVTLPLMPVTPETKEASPSPTASDGHVSNGFFGCATSWERTSVYQPCASDLETTCQNGYISSSALSARVAPGTQNNNFSEGTTNNNNDGGGNSSGGSHVVAPRPVRPAGSWVTVECVTCTWRDGELPLDAVGLDACPSFVSDACDRVVWVNEAYRRMVVGRGGGWGEEVRVALVTRGMVPCDVDACFTCRARVRHVCRERGKVSMVVPCDVWRLGGGRSAWRLDVKAALSLSLGCEM